MRHSALAGMGGPGDSRPLLPVTSELISQTPGRSHTEWLHILLCQLLPVTHSQAPSWPETEGGPEEWMPALLEGEPVQTQAPSPSYLTR